MRDGAPFAVLNELSTNHWRYATEDGRLWVADVLHRTGHGMGLLGHEFPEDMAFNTRPLLANEVYSAEPGLYVFGLGGFRNDDTVVVGNVPEVLTRAPMDLASQTVG